MSKKNKKSSQRAREELSEEQLGKVSGGVAAIPLPRDEGPTETISFVYHKIETTGLGSLTPKK